MTGLGRAARFVLPALLLAALGVLLLRGATPPGPPPREAAEAPPAAPRADADLPAPGPTAATPPPEPPPAAGLAAAPSGASPAETFDQLVDRLSGEARGAMFRMFRGHFDPLADPNVREEWVTLAGLPDEVRRRLLDLLDDKNPDVRARALLALSRVELAPAEVEELARRFEQEFPGIREAGDVRTAFTFAFALARNDSRTGVERFAQALRTGEMSEVPDFRGQATLLLAFEAGPAEDALLRSLLASDPDADVRRHAATGLARTGGTEDAAALARALAEDADPRVRARSASSLGWLSLDAGSLPPALLRALAEDGAGEVRGAAAVALARAGDAQVGPLLVEAFRRDEDSRARLGAVAGVARLGEASGETAFLDAEASPFLRNSVLAADSPRLRSYAVRLLPEMPPSEENRAALRQAAAADGHPRVRSRAVAAVARTEGEGARAFLTERLAEEKDGRVRGALEAALASLPAPEPR